MTVQHPYRREIDASRPGSDDLQLPELADLARAVASDPRVAKDLAASHASDMVLCDGLHEVPIPSGLADRLLSAMSSPSRDAMVAVASNSVLSAPLVLPVAQPAPADGVQHRLSRRAWLVALPALAATALAAVGLLFWRQAEPKRFSQDQLASHAEEWYQAALPQKGWQTNIDPATAKEFPIDAVVQVRPVAQRKVPVEGDAEGIAYDLRSTSRRAVLFVIKTRDHYDVAPLAYTSLKTTTGDKSVAAWQTGGFLYVLVVEGGRGGIREFVQPRDLT